MGIISVQRNVHPTEEKPSRRRSGGHAEHWRFHMPHMTSTLPDYSRWKLGCLERRGMSTSQETGYVHPLSLAGHSCSELFYRTICVFDMSFAPIVERNV